MKRLETILQIRKEKTFLGDQQQVYYLQAFQRFYQQQKDNSQGRGARVWRRATSSRRF